MNRTTLLRAKSWFSVVARSACPPQPGSSLHPSNAYVLQCLTSWALKNVVFSRVWGVMAPMGRLVACLGRPGHQNRPKSIPKGSLLLYLLACWFEGLVFFAFCVVFQRVRTSMRSRRRSRNAVFHFRRGLQRVSFLQQLLEHFWNNWRRDF